MGTEGSNPQGLDVGTAQAWARHQRKMATDQQVSRIRRMLNRGTVWGRVRGTGRGTWVEVGSGQVMREGIRLA